MKTLNSLILYSAAITALSTPVLADQALQQSQGDILAANQRIVTTSSFCSQQGETVVSGDFNGDGLQDKLCNSAEGKMTIALGRTDHTMNISWTEEHRDFCTREGSKMAVGDFNGDGKDDLLCNSRWGAMYIDLADASGHFNRANWRYGNRNFCKKQGEQLLTGDFNGDGKSDLLCSYPDGKKQIDLANKKGQFYSSNWTGSRNFCNGQQEQLSIADANNDKRDDLICSSSEGLTLAVDLSSPSTNMFDGSDWVACSSGLCEVEQTNYTAKR